MHGCAIDVEDALGLRVGDAHIIRNAGALASEDAIRSLVVSQQLLGTREIVVIAHTQCRLHRADRPVITERIEDTTGFATDMGSAPSRISMRWSSAGRDPARRAEAPA